MRVPRSELKSACGVTRRKRQASEDWVTMDSEVVQEAIQDDLELLEEVGNA